MSDFINRIIVRVNGNTNTPSNKTTNDIFFDTAIDKSDFQIGGSSFHVKGMFSANLFDEIDFSWIEECFVFIGIVFFADDNTSETGSAFPKECYDCAGIDT